MQERRVQRIVTAVPCFLIGFGLAASIIHHLIPNKLHLYAEQRSEKIAELYGYRGSGTVAAFGSSHIHCGFDPRAFDKRMSSEWKDEGKGELSVNLAIQGGSQTEQRAMALEYLRAMNFAGKTPKIVFLELSAGANFTNDHLMHPRAINIYDLDTFKLSLQFADSTLPKGRRLGRIGYAAVATSLYYLNVGMLSNVIFGHDLNQQLLTEDLKENHRGLLTSPSSRKLKADVAESVNGTSIKVDDYKIAITEGSRRLVEILSREAEKLFGRERCPTFVYLVAPLIADRDHRPEYPESIHTAVGDVPVINVARSDKFPDLFTVPMWRDRAHLSAKGADRFSQIVAEELSRRQEFHVIR